MRNFLLASAVLLLNSAAFSQSNVDVLQYRFQLSLNDNNDTIYGEAGIWFVREKGTTTAAFDLTGINKEGLGMKVESVKYLYGWPGEINIRKATFSHTADKIAVSLDKDLLKQDTCYLIINYKGIPADGLIISKNKYGSRTFFADNWPNRGHNWIPCHDNPADKAAVEFIVTAPQHYQVVSNGIRVEESNLPGDRKRTHWKEEVPISTKVMVIGVADFAVSLSGTVNDCIPIYSWVYPENMDYGFYDYAQATDILPWFIKNVGPYGYKKLANVQSKTTFGGLENANTIFYAESSVNGQRTSESLIVHEIAHQWFGNMATEKSFAHLWLSEGFATYMTILYMEATHGKDTARKMLMEDREQAVNFARQSNRPVVDNTKDYMELLNANSYQKGGWILHMLRRELGDTIFWKSIRRYYADYAGKTADTDDLRKVFETVSGKNLKIFFQQWLFTAGAPDLNISWKYDAGKKQVAVTVEQKNKNLFQFPLELALKGNNSSLQKITVSKAKETFYLPVKEAISSVKADPSVSLLFSAVVTEEK